MKTKSDFVTNSSSCCFVIWGVSLRNSDILNNEKLLRCIYEKYKEYYNEFEEFKNSTDDFRSKIYSICDGILESSTGKWDEDCWIGGNPNSMKDDQTLGDYKKEIKKELSKIGIEVDTLEYIEEGWYDG